MGEPLVDAPPEEQGIAVVGLAGRFPGAPDTDTLWRRLVAGDELIEHFAPEAVEDPDVTLDEASAPGYVRARGVLDDVDRFDAGFFGYSAREAEILDPQLRLFLETAWHALENAGYAGGRHDGLTGVYAGAGANTYAWNHLAHHPELARTLGRYQLLIGNEKDFLATSVSYRLDLRGPSLTVQTACSTSLVAIHLAALSLASYDCDLALAGGVSVQLPQRAGYRYEEGGILSPDGHCRAFDAAARGMVGGSGVGAVVLKRLPDALADGDTVRAVLLGTAINNDGALKIGYTAPSLEGQAEVIAAAQAVAGIDPESVGYVEAHGTGTPLGDPIEVAALTRVFRAATDRRGFCALGSIKTNLGHLDAAAGVTGVIKAVLALEHGAIPPSLHFHHPNPRLELDTSPFFVPDRPVPWPRGEVPRRAGVSSFGIGGTNAHAVLEEAPAPHRPSSTDPDGSADPAARPMRPARRWQILPLSAREAETLDRLTERTAAWLDEPPARDAPGAPALADAAFTLQVGRGSFDHRRVAIAADRAEAAQALRGALPGSLLEGTTSERRRPVCFLVPGQGGRLAGRGRAVYDGEPVFREAVDRCAERLAPDLELDLRELLFPPAGGLENAEARLGETRLAQPALFTLAWASARLWQSWGIEASGILGHSVGELVAAALCGLFELDDALALVAERGRLMHTLPPGAMATVELSEEEIGPWLGEELSLAAVNAPDLVTVTGPAAAIDELGRQLAEADGDSTARRPGFRRLATAHAFHSPDTDALLAPFAEAVERLPRRAPERPWVSSLTGDWIRPDEVTTGGYWARHLRRPVRFARGLATLLADEPNAAFVELGPGRGLGSLLRRQPDGRGRIAVATLSGHRAAGETADRRSERRKQQESGQDAVEDPGQVSAQDGERGLAGALARLWLAGVAIDWQAYAGTARPRRIPLPGYPFAHRRYWIEGRPPLSGGASAAPVAGTGSAHTDPPEDADGTATAEPPAPANRHPRPDLGVPRVAPRDDTERALTEVWEELLGVGGIGVHDDFFELGGHSLLALRLAAHLEERFGKALQTSAVAEASTVALQADLLRGAPAATAASGHSLLVPLGAAARKLLGADEGSPVARGVLVLVHPVGGGVVTYRELARRLEESTGVAVFGLRASGYEAGEEPADSVEQLAERHLDTLREALGSTLEAARDGATDGASLGLGGWSFGGVVAFEMARRLEQEGLSTGPVVLVDSAPSGTEGGGPLEEADLVAAFVRDLVRTGEAGDTADTADTGGAWPELDELAAAGDLDQLLASSVAAGLLPAGAEPRVRRLFDLFRRHALAHAAHRPTPWRADALLLEADARPPAEPRPRDLWAPLVQGRLEAVALPGDHYSILSPPTVERLAEIVAGALATTVGPSPSRGD